ncbi:hypothetical protein K8T06_07205 [bacterium]|nr:hypothetical protein [bacterium]
MKTRLFLYVLCIVTLLANFVYASPVEKFTISAEFGKPLAEHIEWCKDLKITTEAISKQLTVPQFNKLDMFLDRMDEFFIPNDLVPPVNLFLEIKDENNSSSFDMIEINTFINDREDDVIDWLNLLTSELTDKYAPNPTPRFRFRLFNEINTFKTVSAEDYYYVLNWFYPLFKEHGPKGSTLLISFAGCEGSDGTKNYLSFLRVLLQMHPVDEKVPLPFDGIDIHRSYQT